MKRINFFCDKLSYVLLCCFIILLASCTKKFADINTDKNSIATIGAAELPFLFSRAFLNAQIRRQDIPS